MMTFAYEYPIIFQIIVTDGTDTNSFSYNFGKDQGIEISVNESLLLAQCEIDKRAQPVPIAI